MKSHIDLKISFLEFLLRLNIKEPDYVGRHATCKTLHSKQHKESGEAHSTSRRPHNLHNCGRTDRDPPPPVRARSYTWETFCDSLACLMLYNHLMIRAFRSIAEMP